MLADGFSRFLDSDPDRLHAAAHSHHPWPDVTFAAQQQAWLDAARRHDGKWDHVMGEVLPEAQRHIAGRLGLSDPTTIAVAPNTHELVVRLFSALPTPARVLTTDAEFHSFERQLRRYAEDGLVTVERVPAQPFETFPERLASAAAHGGHDLVFVSQVHFDSGYVLADLSGIARAVPDPETFVVIDGYHGFMALPTDLSAVEDRAFYLAGGYKYAMAGEGAVFMHCPPGYAPRPADTGWYAGFSSLADGGDRVTYAADGSRFLGATFDPTGWYRFNAVQRWLDDGGVDVPMIHRHVGRLQSLLLDRLTEAHLDVLPVESLVPGRDAVSDRGHFLTFASPRAAAIDDALAVRHVVVDHRGDRLRIGLGVYHEEADIDRLVDRLSGTGPWPPPSPAMRATPGR